jgi:hypothetical protein
MLERLPSRDRQQDLPPRSHLTRASLIAVTRSLLAAVLAVTITLYFRVAMRRRAPQ